MTKPTKITDRPIDSLRAHERNPRTISKARFEDLKASIKADPDFMRVRPIIVNTHEGREGIIIGGNMRWRAAKELGWDTVPCLEVDADPDQELTRLVKDNQHSGDDDRDALAELILPRAEVFEHAMPGDRLDKLLNDYGGPEEPTEEQQVDTVAAGEPITKPGDVWTLGEHKILCGDSTDAANYALLLEGAKADMTWTDPPYNVAYGATMKDKLRGTDNRRIENDDMDALAFRDFLRESLSHIVTNTKGACYVCMSSSELGALRWAWEKAGGKWSTFVIWAKKNFTMGRSDYQRQYEPIMLGRTVKLTEYEAIAYGWPKDGQKEWFGGRAEGDVWFFDRPASNPIHPTQKPVELVVRAITNSSKRNDIVLDPFLGGGSTLIACEKTKRRCRGCELDPKFVDACIARWIGHTRQLDVLRNGEPYHWEGPIINLAGVHG